MMTLPLPHPVLYRARQFFVAVKVNLPAWAGGGLAAIDEATVAAVLTTPAQRRLFNQMPPNDRRHAVAVAGALQQAGYNQPPLLQAALLHDVAKSLGQPIICRVAIVLLEVFWPAGLKRISKWTNQQIGELVSWQLAEKLGEGHSRSASYNLNSSFILQPSSFLAAWRRPFVIHAHHPAIGAAWATEAGCDPMAVRLIARHQDSLPGPPETTEDELLTALQWADNLN